MNNRSRSTLFLIEQLIVIAVFALCAAACARILTAAYFSARDARDLSNALHNAESCAETFKATGGEIGKAIDILGGVKGGAAGVVYYDSNWHICGKDNADYWLALEPVWLISQSDRLLTGEITVYRIDGDELVTLTVAARRGQE